MSGTQEPGVTSTFAANPALRDFWYVAAAAATVGDQPLPVELLGQRMVLWRAAGAVHAAADRCPHREAPLSRGRLVEDCLQCPYHGWEFAADGTCTRIPSSGAGVPIPRAARIDIAAAVESYGLVWVCLGTPRGSVPAIAQDADPAFRRFNNPVEEWAVSATRMTDNFLDIAHFPFVHADTIGGAQYSAAPRVEVRALDEFFVGYEYDVEVSNPVAGRLASGSSSPSLRRHMSTGFNLPFLTRSTIRYESGLEHVLLLCTTPVDDERSLFTFVAWRNDDHAVPADELIAFDRAIGAEDRRMLEAIAGVLPLAVTDTVNVQSDKASIEWRRQLAQLLAGAGDGRVLGYRGRQNRSGGGRC